MITIHIVISRLKIKILKQRSIGKKKVEEIKETTKNNHTKERMKKELGRQIENSKRVSHLSNCPVCTRTEYPN